MRHCSHCYRWISAITTSSDIRWSTVANAIHEYLPSPPHLQYCSHSYKWISAIASLSNIRLRYCSHCYRWLSSIATSSHILMNICHRHPIRYSLQCCSHCYRWISAIATSSHVLMKIWWGTVAIATRHTSRTGRNSQKSTCWKLDYTKGL